MCIENHHCPKRQAELLKKYLNEKEIEIGHSQCLHAVSRMYGYKDWNTFSAVIKKLELSQEKNFNV